MWHFDLAPELELAASAHDIVSEEAFKAMMAVCDRLIQWEAAEIAASLVSSGAPAPEIAVVIVTALTLIGAAMVTLFTGPVPAIAACLMGVTATPIWCWREAMRA